MPNTSATPLLINHTDRNPSHHSPLWKRLLVWGTALTATVGSYVGMYYIGRNSVHDVRDNPLGSNNVNTTNTNSTTGIVNCLSDSFFSALMAKSLSLI